MSETNLLLSYGTAQHTEQEQMDSYKVLASLHIKPKVTTADELAGARISWLESAKAFGSTGLSVGKA